MAVGRGEALVRLAVATDPAALEFAPEAPSKKHVDLVVFKIV